jgi:hypothetical protein
MAEITVTGYAVGGWQVAISENEDEGLVPGEQLHALIRYAEKCGLKPRDEGDQNSTFDGVARITQLNGDGSETPVLILYRKGHQRSWVKVYLNTAQDVKAAQNALGFELSAIPAYEGKGNPDRTDATIKYIKEIKPPVEAGWKPNPKFDPDKDALEQKIPARFFTGWVMQKAHDSAPKREAPAENDGKFEDIPGIGDSERRFETQTFLVEKRVWQGKERPMIVFTDAEKNCEVIALERKVFAPLKLNDQRMQEIATEGPHTFNRKFAVVYDPTPNQVQIVKRLSPITAS